MQSPRPAWSLLCSPAFMAGGRGLDSPQRQQCFLPASNIQIFEYNRFMTNIFMCDLN